MYEGGIRVAGGIYWKNQIRPAVRDNFVMLSDMFPTLCDLTAVPVSHEIDGISILPLLRGEEQDTGDRMVHWVRRKVIPDMVVKPITHLAIKIIRSYKTHLGNLSNSSI